MEIRTYGISAGVWDLHVHKSLIMDKHIWFCALKNAHNLYKLTLSMYLEKIEGSKYLNSLFAAILYVYYYILFRKE
jgi:hypothetical protein